MADKVDLVPRTPAVLGSMPSAGAHTGAVFRYASRLYYDNGAAIVQLDIGVVSVVASEALTAGNWVNLHSNAGTLNVRKADNTTSGKEVDGFVLANASSSATVDVYTVGVNTAVSGQTVGPVYLGAAGAGSSSAPTTSGYLLQKIGKALSATAVLFRPDSTILLA